MRSATLVTLVAVCVCAGAAEPGTPTASEVRVNRQLTSTPGQVALAAEDIVRAMRNSLEKDVELELIDFSRYPVPQGELVFPQAGLQAPAHATAARLIVWRGKLQLANGRSIGVWARVRLSARIRAVVARVDLKGGGRIAAEAIEVREVRHSPCRQAPAGETSEVAGSVARRSIRAGEPIYSRMLSRPREIEPGDPVTLQVRTGPAILTVDARAESAGGVGQRITVRNVNTGRRIQATVQGPGRAAVEAQ